MHFKKETASSRWPGDSVHSTLNFINYSCSFPICKRIPFAFMFSFCNHVAPGPVMMSNNGQAVTNTTGSVTSLLGVGEFSWRVNSKGHLISKCLFGVIVSTKIVMRILLRFLPWNFLKLPGGLVCNNTKKEAYSKPKKISGSFKNFHGKNRNDDTKKTFGIQLCFSGHFFFEQANSSGHFQKIFFHGHFSRIHLDIFVH